MFNNFFHHPQQYTALNLAVKACDVDTVRYLVDKGADINIKDDNGVSECDYNVNHKQCYKLGSLVTGLEYEMEWWNGKWNEMMYS